MADYSSLIMAPLQDPPYLSQSLISKHRQNQHQHHQHFSHNSQQQVFNDPQSKELPTAKASPKTAASIQKQLQAPTSQAINRAQRTKLQALTLFPPNLKKKAAKRDGLVFKCGRVEMYCRWSKTADIEGVEGGWRWDAWEKILADS